MWKRSWRFILQPRAEELTKPKSGRINAGREESKVFTAESIRLTKAKDKYETN
jgi:hypothetical protein